MFKVLNAHQASDMLGISKATLYRLTAQGHLKKVRISSRRVGWLSQDLETFIENRKLNP